MKVMIIAESKKNAPSIANTFISEIGDNKTGNINKPIFETREIKTDINDDIFTEISSRLNQNETVVIFKPDKNKN